MPSIEDTIQMVIAYWPDYAITKADLVKPTSEFVIRFYTDFANEIEEHISTITGTTTPQQELNSELNLYKRVNKVFMKVNQWNTTSNTAKFRLGDILAPTAVRTRNFIAICSHLMCYIAKISEESTNAVADTWNKYKEMVERNLEYEKCLKRCDENATELGRLKDRLERLKVEHTEISTNYQEMQFIKSEKERELNEKHSRMEELKRDKEIQEYAVKELTIKEQTLRESVVKEEEYKRLEKTLNNLEQQYEELGKSEETLEEKNEALKNNISYLQECSAALKNLSMNMSDMETNPEDKLRDLHEKIRILSTRLHSLQNHKKQLLQEMVTHKMGVSTTENLLKETKQEYQTMLFNNQALLGQLKTKFDIEYHTLTTRIRNLNEEIEKYKNDMELLKAGFIDEYKKFSIAERETTMAFHKHLRDLSELSQKNEE